jgi:GMP synthase-like glutamine amidotransferase
MTAPALFLQHGDDGPPGLLADWARDRGIPFIVHRVDLDPEHLPDLDEQPFIVSLGSDRSPNDSEVLEVAAELDLLRRAVDRGIPVLGVCYGGQALALVLGGAVERAPEPELGWHHVESHEPDRVPGGHWLQWHYDRFTLPPGARALARSARALQAFAHGPHLGLQFHPESTAEIVAGWARSDAKRLLELGIEDGERLAEAGREHVRAARDGAFKLFDAFWHRRAEPSGSGR